MVPSPDTGGNKLKRIIPVIAIKIGIKTKNNFEKEKVIKKLCM